MTLRSGLPCTLLDPDTVPWHEKDQLARVKSRGAGGRRLPTSTAWLHTWHVTKVSISGGTTERAPRLSNCAGNETFPSTDNRTKHRDICAQPSFTKRTSLLNYLDLDLYPLRL